MSQEDPIQSVVDALKSNAPAPGPNATEVGAPTEQATKEPLTPYEQEIKRAELKQRHWVVRVFVLCVAFICVVIVSSIAYVYAVKGGNFEGSAIDSMMKNLTELLKLFGSPPAEP